jgi:hypothetical protein
MDAAFRHVVGRRMNEMRAAPAVEAGNSEPAAALAKADGFTLPNWAAPLPGVALTFA